MKMPFGKFKGVLVEDIFKEHLGYAIWLSELPTLKDPLASHIIKLCVEYRECMVEYKESEEMYYDVCLDDRDWPR